jgi:hypothetical protein
VVVFDSTGRYRFTMGRRGQGPGDLFSTTRLALIRGDSFAVHAVYGEGNVPSRVSIFTPDGKFASSYEIGVFTWFTPLAFDRLGNVTAKGYSYSDRNAPRDNATNQPLATYRTHDRLHRANRSGCFGSFGDIPAPSQYPVWQHLAVEAVRDSLAYVTSTDAAEILVYRVPTSCEDLKTWNDQSRIAMPAPIRRIPTGLKAVAVTDADIAAHREMVRPRSSPNLPERFRVMAEKNFEAMTFAKNMPLFGGLLVDDGHTVFARRFSPRYRTRPTHELEIYGPAGRHLGTLRLPEGFAPNEIGRDYVLGVWLDDDDVPYVRVYRLFRP